MNKKQFFSAVLIYLFVISILPIGFIMDKVNAAEIPNNYADYEVSQTFIWDADVQEDLAILSKNDGIYTNKDGKMERKNNGKYTFGSFWGKTKECEYLKTWNNIIEFNLTTGNYKMLKLPFNTINSRVTSATVDKQGNKWFAITETISSKQKEYSLLRINANDEKSQKFKLEGTNGKVYNLKCDAKNNIWFQGGDKNQIIGKVSFDATNNQISQKTFKLSSSNELLSKFEVNKDGEVFIASYKDGRVWEILKYREVNGQMIFDKSIDSKTASFTADNNGELWFLTKGDTPTSNYNVCKFENNGLNKKYDVSTLMGKLKVYNENNMILTGENLDNLHNGEVTYVYKVISSYKTISSHKVGWDYTNGKWYYYDNNGIIKNDWYKVGNVWYYFDNDGSMTTGWRSVDGKWYYLGDGAMRTGWVSVGSKWYYLNASGDMASNTTIGGYRLGSDGAWIH